MNAIFGMMSQSVWSAASASIILWSAVGRLTPFEMSKTTIHSGKQENFGRVIIVCALACVSWSYLINSQVQRAGDCL